MFLTLALSSRVYPILTVLIATVRLVNIMAPFLVIERRAVMGVLVGKMWIIVEQEPAKSSKVNNQSGLVI